MTSVDLNCDLGEGGDHDAELMTLITSANVACGGHAGDEAIMHDTVRQAQTHGVAIGAHPGFADREYFGRREMNLAPKEIEQLVREQMTRLIGIARECGASVTHVKPHGALYNQSAREAVVADAIARAVRSIDEKLILIGLAGSELISAGLKQGLRVGHEAFADRNYQADGTLVPRTRPDCMISDSNAAARRALQMCLRREVETNDGTRRAISVDTLCIHGDGFNAVSMARELRKVLSEGGITLSNLTTDTTAP